MIHYFNYPLVAIVFEGNVKEKLITNPHICYCSFEICNTLCFIKTNQCDFNKEAKEIIERDFGKYGKIIKIDYSETGAQVEFQNSEN